MGSVPDEWPAEAQRLAIDMLKRKRFRVVCALGEETFWRHKDGRSIKLSTDSRGLPTIIRLDTNRK